MYVKSSRMESLPADIYMKILSLLDHQDLATAQLVCRKWRDLSMDDMLWSNLFQERWGVDSATFYEPIDSKSWKDVYIVQDRSVRIGLGLKIVREGKDYFLVHQGEIQQHLGSRRKGSRELESFDLGDDYGGREEEPCSSILDKILFFIGDLEAASVDLKRRRLI